MPKNNPTGPEPQAQKSEIERLAAEHTRLLQRCWISWSQQQRDHKVIISSGTSLKERHSLAVQDSQASARSISEHCQQQRLDAEDLMTQPSAKWITQSWNIPAIRLLYKAQHQPHSGRIVSHTRSP